MSIDVKATPGQFRAWRLSSLKREADALQLVLVAFERSDGEIEYRAITVENAEKTYKALGRVLQSLKANDS